MKQLHEIIAECIRSKTWRYLVAASDWAMQKDIQYTIYQVVKEREPERRYGYRKRVLSYIAENQVITRGGVLLSCQMDENTIKHAIREMERGYSSFDAG